MSNYEKAIMLSIPGNILIIHIVEKRDKQAEYIIVH